MVKSIDEVPVGENCRVFAIDDLSEWAPALRRMGFREGIEIERLSRHDPVLLRCGNTRVAVCRRMLNSIAFALNGYQLDPECCCREVAEVHFSRLRDGLPQQPVGNAEGIGKRWCWHRFFGKLFGGNCDCHKHLQ